MTDHTQQTLDFEQTFIQPAPIKKKFVPFETYCPHCFALISDYPCHICKRDSPYMEGFEYSEIIGLSDWLFNPASTDTPTFVLVKEVP